MTPARYDAVAEAARTVQERIGDVPDVAVVLGSGLGAFAGSLSDATVVPYSIIPHWPAAKIVGRFGESEDRHDLGGRGDDEAGFTRRTVGTSTETGSDLTQ